MKKLFISYAHTDKWQVNELVDILRQGNYDPWFDHRLIVGRDWKEQLLEAITKCNAFVYILSPESVESEWCQWEFAEAAKLGKPIIPVLIQSNTSIPISISSRQYADFTEGATPPGVARLMAGIHSSITIPPEEVDAPENPRGKPAQIISQSSIFISYSRDDKEYAYKVEEYLRNNGFRVWIDKHGLSVQDKWIRKIEKAIEDCAAFIVIMTPSSKESEWVQRELHYAEECGKPLFPLLLGGKIWFQLGTTHSIDVTDAQLPDTDFVDKLALFAHRDEVEQKTVGESEDIKTYTLYLSFVGSDPVVRPFADKIQSVIKDNFPAWGVVISSNTHPSIRNEMFERSTLVVFLLGVFYGSTEQDKSLLEQEYDIVRAVDRQRIVFVLPDEMPAGISLQILAQQSQLLSRQLELRQRAIQDKPNTFSITENNQVIEYLFKAINHCVAVNATEEASPTNQVISQNNSRWHFFSDRDQTHVTYDRRLLDGNLLDELDEHLVRQFLERPLARDEARKAGLRLPTLQQHMELLGLMHNGKITLGAFLCFAPKKEIAHFASACTLQMVVYSETQRGGDSASPILVVDNLINLFEEGLEFLTTKAGLVRMGLIGSSSRDDLEIPEIALREALANAIVHRDYEDDILKRQPTRIEVYPDRVEITSFGILLGGITVDDLNNDPENITAFRRNEIIALIFQYMAYVELFGSGISRIYRLTKKANLQRPKIEFNEKQPTVKVTLYRPEQRLRYHSKSSQTSVFISYSREDGTEYAERLSQSLNRFGIKTWYDMRDLDKQIDFTSETENSIETATHFIVIVTESLKQADSFVRLEIGYALTSGKVIIPLQFPKGHRPITIINYTFIDFSNWDEGFQALLERLSTTDQQVLTPETRREREISYLAEIGRRYDHWRELYTDLSGTTRTETTKIKVKSDAKYLEMRHEIFDDLDRNFEVNRFDDLREAIRSFQRVALVGSPGSGKTTTLERLAYELATEAIENPDASIPLFVRLDSFDGQNFVEFLASNFVELDLTEYLPHRVFLLLDGLNEVQPQYATTITKWIKENGQVSLVVTCRAIDYMELTLPLQRIDINPMNLERIRLFMGDYLEDEDRERLFWSLAGRDAQRAWVWYQRENEEATYLDFFMAEDEPGNTWIPERKLLDSIRNALKERDQLPDMLNLVTNPFLMRIVIEVFALTGTPPSNSGDLFGRFVDLLLNERGKTAAQDNHPWIPEKLQKQALATLAYRIQNEAYGTDVSLNFVYESFKQALPEQEPKSLLYFAISSTILEQTDTIRFSNQFLLEYFAAYEMGKDLRRGISAKKYFPEDNWWEPNRWEETAILLAGLYSDGSTPVADWIKDANPLLAARCITQSGANYPPETTLVTLREHWLSWLVSEPIPQARAAVGQALGQLNLNDGKPLDNRKGVGIETSNGVLLPDIDWIEIVADSTINAQITPFSISRFLITHVQFRCFIEAEDYPDGRWWEGLPENSRELMTPFNIFSNHPRTRVSWFAAIAFCRWLSAKSNTHITLPTTAQWLRATGTSSKYPWGDEYHSGYANLNDKKDSLSMTSTVGIYAQGATIDGIMDLIGNVWEWCLDEQEQESPKKALKGGSWIDSPEQISIQATYFATPDWSTDYVGFRIVKQIT